MLKRRKDTPEPPELLGEDFEIFPDLNNTPKNKSEQTSTDAMTPADDSATPPPAEEDPEPTDLQKKIAEIPEAKWKLYQRLAGIFFGLLTGAAITFGDHILGNSMGFLLAAVIAILLPNFLEKQAARPTKQMRLVMAATLALWLVVYFLVFQKMGILPPEASAFMG